MTDPVHALLGDQYRYDPNSGDYYAVIHQQIAEEIHRLWPNLSLAWVPPKNRTSEDTYPFALIETDVFGKQHLVCNCTEEELPLLMERIWEMNKDQGDILKKIDNHNDAIKKQIATENQDAMTESHDKLFHLLNGKFTYKMDGVKIVR